MLYVEFCMGQHPASQLKTIVNSGIYKLFIELRVTICQLVLTNLMTIGYEWFCGVSGHWGEAATLAKAVHHSNRSNLG